jgi:hypothetical protein
MSETIELKVGDDTHFIPAKPFTLLARSGQMLEPIEVKRAIMIDAEVAQHHGSLVNRLHDNTQAWLLYCLGVAEIDGFSADRVRKLDGNVVRLMGLIDLCLKLSQMGVPLHVRFPEAGQHPKVQLGLADLFITISNGEPNAQPPRR